MKEKEVIQGFSNNLNARNRKGVIWHIIFQASTLVGIVALIALMLNIVNSAFGYVAYEARVDPDTFTVDGVPLEEQNKEQLLTLLQSELSRGAYNKLNNEEPFEERSRENVFQLIVERIIRPKVVAVWDLWPSLTQVDEIRATVAQDFPTAELDFVSWLTYDFVTRPQTSEALTAGVRTAILGSLWTIFFTILLAFPVGVGAAIYLEEYASDNWFNRIIQTNINNLAGVPSIVYGILGLAIFVRTLEPLTSGEIFGLVDPTTANGRTVLSAGLTLGLLVLPIIIINAQEAIRAVPRSLRNASFGVGATKWQTVWSHVLPNAMPGILTGTILAVSRAIGETAPLVVVGASTAISFDPESPFSKFTTLPIQIYQWTARPQAEFQSLAAASILVLLVLLLSLNASAVLLRNRFSRRF
ncbi:MAG TPA: phosphate ABC transporter permease PtsA [Anaerolineae bacterium]|nr:phosphate ABC transporter permease PtsA [Anaerolineae bacterium]HCK66750.1 phosphate ABC transporter permease PtsA [Anaerolineae bacterium]HCR71514.1 phosphate ABC transporter permease PtsA [Anaerolineae bacterium]